ncbi:MAG TPA: hypothetical protein VF928_11510 [Usitatibacteraceae bacterium]
MIQIGNNEKFAIIALPQLWIDSPNLSQAKALGNGLGFYRQMPFSLESHWREWIGTTQADQIAKAQLFLIAKCASNTPAILDDENLRLADLAGRLLQGLQLALPFRVSGIIVQLTGANNDGNISVRQFATVPVPFSMHRENKKRIDDKALFTAAELVPILCGFPQGKYLRLCRVLNVFFSGILEKDVRERLHQFCRCIEGLIFADQGQTTRQFKSRTELFVGPSAHDFMGNLYENRSAVEHMNDPILDSEIGSERYKFFAEMTIIAEDIARYCLLNILLSPTLRERFFDETSLAAFWALEASDRKRDWGEPLDIAKLRKH